MHKAAHELSPTAGGWQGAGRTEYEFYASNPGPAAARNLMATLTDADGRELLPKVYPNTHGPAPVMPGDTACFPLYATHGLGRPAWCVVTWEDESGHQTTRVTVPPEAPYPEA